MIPTGMEPAGMILHNTHSPGESGMSTSDFRPQTSVHLVMCKKVIDNNLIYTEKNVYMYY